MITTNSHPIEIPKFAFDQNNILNSTNTLTLSKIPKHLIIINKNYINLELNNTYTHINSKITIIKIINQLLPKFEKNLIHPIKKTLKKNKTNILLKHKTLNFKKNKKVLEYQIKNKNNKPKSIKYNKILITIKQHPNSKNLKLKATNVTTNKHNFITINNQYQTNTTNVYTIKNITNNMMLTHKTSKETKIITKIITNKPTIMDVQCIPTIVFTNPKITTIKITKKKTKETNHKIQINKYPFTTLNHTMTTNKTKKFVHIIVNKNSHKILNTQIIKSNANNLITKTNLNIKITTFTNNVNLTIHTHPNLPKTFMETAQTTINKTVHLINK